MKRDQKQRSDPNPDVEPVSRQTHRLRHSAGCQIQVLDQEEELLELLPPVNGLTVELVVPPNQVVQQINPPHTYTQSAHHIVHTIIMHYAAYKN